MRGLDCAVWQSIQWWFGGRPSRGVAKAWFDSVCSGRRCLGGFNMGLIRASGDIVVGRFGWCIGRIVVVVAKGRGPAGGAHALGGRVFAVDCLHVDEGGLWNVLVANKEA